MGRRDLAGAALWGGRTGRRWGRGRTCSAGTQSSMCGIISSGNWRLLRRRWVGGQGKWGPGGLFYMAGAPARMCGMGGGNWKVLRCGVAGQGGRGGGIQCSRAVNKCGMGGKNWRCGRPAQSGVGGWGGWGCGCDLQCRHAGKHVWRGRRELAGAALWGGRTGRGEVRGRTCSAGAQSSMSVSAAGTGTCCAVVAGRGGRLSYMAGKPESMCSMGGGNWRVLRCRRPALWAGGKLGRVGIWL